MHVPCPNCSDRIELDESRSTGDIHCAACGSNFRLASATTIGWQPSAAQRIGKFELLTLVGSGAYGSVFKARDTELDRIVAFKKLRDAYLAASVTQLERARQAGYFADLERAAAIRTHDEFTSLRGRPDFQAFVEKIP